MKSRLVVLLFLTFILSFLLAKVNSQNFSLLSQVKEKIEPTLVAYIKNVTEKTSIPQSTKISVIVLLQPNENPKAFIARLINSKKIDPNSKFITFSIINGFAIEVSPNEIFDISLMPEVKKVYLDKKINITDSIFAELPKLKDKLKEMQYSYEEESLNESAHQIGADYLWSLGIRGQGVKVAVLDTGIDKNHPMLKGKVIFEKDLTWWDEKLDANDYFGHGTHVAGIIAGYYENGSVNVSETSTTYFFVERVIVGEGNNQTAIYKIKAIGPYPPLGMFEDSKYPLETNHVKFYDKDGTPIELFTYGNITCNPNQEKCEEKWKDAEFTLVKVGIRSLNVGENYTNETVGTIVSYVSYNNITVISSVSYQRPQEIISGIAPNASLMNIKVLGDEGWGFESSVIKGIEVAIENGAKVISMSLGGFGHPDDILSQVIDKAVEKGVVVVAAAGNEGFLFFFSINSPGTARNALTVGCVDKNNFPCWFTSWGPLESGEIKPDIVAPGYKIISACAENSYLGKMYGCNYTAGKLFIPLSGTSMSTPHVSGLVALLLSANSTLAPKEIKSLLVQNVVNQTLIPLPIIVGSGVVNGTEAYLSLQKYGLIFNPSNLFFGYIYGSEDNSITLRVKNFLDEQVTYSLNYYARLFDENFADLVYSKDKNITLLPKEEKNLTLFINSTKVREILRNDVELINFLSFYVYVEINKTKNYTFPATVIIPEKLNISSLSAYLTIYSKIETVNEGIVKWYWINVYNNTENIWFENYLINSEDNSWGFATFAVVDPENKVKEKNWGWLYYYEWNYPSIKPGKWKIVAFALGEKSYAYISAEKPTLFINWSSAEGTPGDTFIWKKEIKNLIEEPLNISIGKKIYSYVSDKVLEEKSDTILYPYGMGYYEFNISNYTEGVKFEFDFFNIFGCYKFGVYLFDPAGNLNDTGFIGFCNYDPPVLPCQPISVSVVWQVGSWRLLKPEKGTWTLIVVPLYDWYYQRYEEIININLTIRVKDLVKEESWSKPLNNITLLGGEESTLEFNITIPKGIPSYTWHSDIYEINVSAQSLSSTREILIDINVRPFYFTINVSNLPQLTNDKGVNYYLINYTETLVLDARIFGYNNTPKESYASFTFVKVLKFFNVTWSWKGESCSRVYPIVDYENKFTTDYYFINGSSLINLSLPKWISQGYWMLYGIENTTNGSSNVIYLFVVSPIIDIQTSANTTLPLNFSSQKIYIEPFFNTSTVGRIFVISINNITPPGIPLTTVQIEIDENLKRALQWSILRIYYDPNVIKEKRINEDTLSIYWFNETSQKWEKVKSFINKEQHFVWTNVTHFSIWSLSGEPLPTTTVSGTAPSRGGIPLGGGGIPIGGKVSAATKECVENWSCTEWSICYPNGTQYRTCIDLNNCGTTKNKPEEVRNCTYIAPAKTPICGNGICERELGENQSNCCKDCGCPEGYECVNGSCIAKPICGNRVCEEGENINNCPEDCGATIPSTTGRFIDVTTNLVIALIVGLLLLTFLVFRKKIAKIFGIKK